MPTESPEGPAPSEAATPEQIAKEAQRIIDTAPEHGQYKPKEYADAFPPSASELADLLRSKEMSQDRRA